MPAQSPGFMQVTTFGGPAGSCCSLPCSMSPEEPTSALPPLLKPPALVKGDTIGVVAPSYAPRPGWLHRGVKALERAGYGVLLDSEIETVRRFHRIGGLST